MIASPRNWREIGQPIPIEKLETTLLDILTDLNCPDISFSGGIDSSLLVHFSLQAGIKPVLHTIGSSMNHPDIIHSMIAAKHFKKTAHYTYIPDVHETNGATDGDTAVKLLYRAIAAQSIERIVTGDGIDEFMGGYYAHQASPTTETYYSFLKRLLPDHLEHLNINSDKISVHLPYLDPRMLILMAQIPLEHKVDQDFRKKLVIKMAQRADLPEDIIYRRKYGFCSALINHIEPAKAIARK